jgi:hypothetical protein
MTVWRVVKASDSNYRRPTAYQIVRPPALGVTLGDRWKTMQARVP